MKAVLRSSRARSFVREVLGAEFGARSFARGVVCAKSQGTNSKQRRNDRAKSGAKFSAKSARKIFKGVSRLMKFHRNFNSDFPCIFLGMTRFRCMGGQANFGLKPFHTVAHASGLAWFDGKACAGKTCF